MQSEGIKLGLQTVYFSPMAPSEFAPQVVESCFRVDVDHHTIGVLRLSGVVHDVSPELLLRTLDSDAEDRVIGLLSQIRRRRACVLGISGLRVTCRVRFTNEHHGVAIWRATIDDAEELMEFEGPAELQTVEHLRAMENAVAAELLKRADGNKPA